LLYKQYLVKRSIFCDPPPLSSFLKKILSQNLFCSNVNGISPAACQRHIDVTLASQPGVFPEKATAKKVNRSFLSWTDASLIIICVSDKEKVLLYRQCLAERSIFCETPFPLFKENSKSEPFLQQCQWYHTCSISVSH
jgi:hypothetical protein